MIIVNSGTSNNLLYYSRYSEINKYEILDHNSKIVFSGLTTILGYDGKINHTGLTYDFLPNQTYTYKSYFIYDNVEYLANHSYVRSFSDDSRLNDYNINSKPKNSFKINGK